MVVVSMVIGILALQGGFALHQNKFSHLGISTRLVVCPETLAEISGVVIPGGESSVMLKNATPELWNQLCVFSKKHPVWGVCAGSILLARAVENPVQPGLGIMDMVVRRNAYGSQNESFISKIKFSLNHEFESECIFIRAPQIIEVGKAVNVLAKFDGEPIMVEQHHHIATTFHPELSDTMEFHEYFIEKIRQV